ncbi:hypothetical protein BOW53_00965 [Solemya pervernicosa gill symbiont]|uniref:Uncharacterized protein n=2 Tax=Gammaproteobacteria incertae sedis TaxID=118884 RepID=A0A1T2LAT2_9GAMM|nr:hypothetical protein [Candidatus Reidiella endopervernicosa]OOZ42180.1 hypothetical protein BOW53_00965 [Solemya pervernicosa gill symbiont]QKQ27251.1 hypothetical protein HUE57_13880 [Candidatus Reidiella endopervernicosa]
MASRSAYQIKFSDMALETMMRDVLDGLEDFSTMVGFEANTQGFEVLSITPPEQWDSHNHRTHDVQGLKGTVKTDSNESVQASNQRSSYAPITYLRPPR